MSELKLVRGDADILEVTITQADGTALDPPGLEVFSSIRFTAKRRMSDADEDAIIAKSLGAGIALDDDDTSKILISVDPADTSGLPDYATRLVWDIQVEDDFGPHTIAGGTLKIDPDVTRAGAGS